MVRGGRDCGERWGMVVRGGRDCGERWEGIMVRGGRDCGERREGGGVYIHVLGGWL